jgi:hypothetical protein
MCDRHMTVNGESRKKRTSIDRPETDRKRVFDFEKYRIRRDIALDHESMII